MKPQKPHQFPAWLLIVILAGSILIVSYFLFFRTLNKSPEPAPSPEPSICAEDPTMCMEDKPLIYLYPEETTEITVTLGHPELLVHTYPKYNGSWSVIAEPSGSLTDPTTGRQFYGLYWEGTNHFATIQDTGFIVKGTDTTAFLEEKLRILGLSDREANEFIIYWLPQLESHPYNYIRFATTEEINNYMPLTITPQPDSLIRVIMEYAPLEHPISIPEQILTTPERRGFTVVEWGGSLITLTTN